MDGKKNVPHLSFAGKAEDKFSKESRVPDWLQKAMEGLQKKCFTKSEAFFQRRLFFRTNQCNAFSQPTEIPPCVAPINGEVWVFKEKVGNRLELTAFHHKALNTRRFKLL